MENKERILTIDIKLSRSNVLVLVTIMVTFAILGYLALQFKQANASTSQAVSSVTGLRKFYLTSTTYNGANADVAAVCASGYHFASLWEIHDTTRLQYDSTHGFTRIGDDRGEGPPSGIAGWIRTGYTSAGIGIPGQVNCSVWSSSSTENDGGIAGLEIDWSTAGATFAWDFQLSECSYAQRVWCVEDYVKELYLPVVKRN